MDQITPGMTWGLALLSVGAYSIPLLLIGWLWLRTPTRRTWVALLFFPRTDDFFKASAHSSALTD